jgi:hypothetical protein
VKKVRDLIVLLLVAAPLVTSLNLVGRAVGFTSPWFVLLAMFNFLGLAAFARPLFLLRLPRSLRELRMWETKGKLYKALAVPAYGALLRRTPLRYLNTQVYLGRDASNLVAVHVQTEAAEAAHFWAAALVVPYMVYACVQQWWPVVAWFMIVQVAANLYPILHLRWVRSRLNRFLDKKRLTHARSGQRCSRPDMIASEACREPKC